MPDKANAETLVSKNRTIDRQKKVIIGFIIGCSIGLFILGYVFIEPLRDSIEQLAIGVVVGLAVMLYAQFKYNRGIF